MCTGVISYLKEKKSDLVSVSKIKIMYASAQAHKLLARHMTYFTRRPMAMPVLDEVKPNPFTEQVSQINGFALKEKKSINSWTRSRPSNTLTSPMTKSKTKYQQVRGDRKTNSRPDSSTTALFCPHILHFVILLNAF